MHKKKKKKCATVQQYGSSRNVYGKQQVNILIFRTLLHSFVLNADLRQKVQTVRNRAEIVLCQQIVNKSVDTHPHGCTLFYGIFIQGTL